MENDQLATSRAICLGSGLDLWIRLVKPTFNHHYGDSIHRSRPWPVEYTFSGGYAKNPEFWTCPVKLTMPPSSSLGIQLVISFRVFLRLLCFIRLCFWFFGFFVTFFLFRHSYSWVKVFFWYRPVSDQSHHLASVGISIANEPQPTLSLTAFLWLTCNVCHFGWIKGGNPSTNNFSQSLDSLASLHLAVKVQALSESLCGCSGWTFNGSRESSKSCQCVDFPKFVTWLA